jgi:1-acyl-sn-glycerol-3-phosphate acyltransferase
MMLLRSALFLLWFAILTAVLSLLFCPVLIFPRGATIWLARSWARATLWGLRVFAGIGMEVRGQPPRGAVLVAAKHMSMWDTLALYIMLDQPGIVLKRELLSIPFYGWFLRKAAAIAIDRGGKAGALRKMGLQAKAVLAQRRPILIFPEGTRKKPGAPPDYKPGVAGLYGMLAVPCVPVALNSGVYWTGFLKKPGTIVLAFLEPIPPGLKRVEFMSLLQDRVETATNSLLNS